MYTHFDTARLQLHISSTRKHVIMRSLSMLLRRKRKYIFEKSIECRTTDWLRNENKNIRIINLITDAKTGHNREITYCVVFFWKSRNFARLGGFGKMITFDHLGVEGVWPNDHFWSYMGGGGVWKIAKRDHLFYGSSLSVRKTPVTLEIMVLAILWPHFWNLQIG